MKCSSGETGIHLHQNGDPTGAKLSGQEPQAENGRLESVLPPAAAVAAAGQLTSRANSHTVKTNITVNSEAKGRVYVNPVAGAASPKAAAKHAAHAGGGDLPPQNDRRGHPADYPQPGLQHRQNDLRGPSLGDGIRDGMEPGSGAAPTYQRPPAIQTLQVPGGAARQGHPSGPAARQGHPAGARRGTIVAASKRTRFALQKPTGEESMEGSESTPSPNPMSMSPRSRGRGRGGVPRRSRSPGPKIRAAERRADLQGSQLVPGDHLQPNHRIPVNGEKVDVKDPVYRPGGVGGPGVEPPRAGGGGGGPGLEPPRVPAPRPPNNLPPGGHQPEAACSPITLEYAEELLLMAMKGRCSVLDISDIVKERPAGGYVYIYHNKDRPYAWKEEDGYSWTQILHQMALHTAKGNELDYYHFYIELPSRHSERMRSSPNFRKEAYKLGDYTLVAYIGKSEIVRKREKSLSEQRDVNLRHNNIHRQLQDMTPQNGLPKDEQMAKLLGGGYHTVGGGRTQPHSAQPKQRSQSLERVGSLLRDGGGGHPLLDSRHLSDPDMVAAQLVEQEYLQALVNAKCANSKNKLDHLLDLSGHLSNGKLVKNISIFPSLQVTLVHPDMTREFENICKILYSERCPGDLAEDTIKLFYDHTFQIGSLYITILTYTNYFYLGSPVMPLAINIHERKFKSSHSMFWARVLCDIPALAKYRFPIVINECEPSVHLAVKAHAPNLVQFEGWLHRFQDMDKYMRQKGYGAHAVAYYKACVKYLLMSESRPEMQDRFRKEFENIWPRDFVNYFREKILPKANRLGKWALGELNIYDDNFFNHAGSPQERFHIRCNQFHKWDTLSLPQLLQGCYLLFTFYVNECSCGKAGQGVFAIHPDLKSLFCEMLPENLPYNRCPNPSNIVEYLHSREETFRGRDEDPGEYMMLRGRMDAPASMASIPPNSIGLEQRETLLGQSTGRRGYTPGDWSPGTRDLLKTSAAYMPISTSSLENSYLPTSNFTFDTAMDEFNLGGKMSGFMRGSELGLEEVPSPAPGGSPRHPSSPHRKLSIIPEVPALSDSRFSSRPPSLAELAAAKQKSDSLISDMEPRDLEIVVTSSREPRYPSSTYHLDSFDSMRQPHTFDRVNQHSIDSSVVTEGHYDASFETEEHPNDQSFDLGHPPPPGQPPLSRDQQARLQERTTRTGDGGMLEEDDPSNQHTAITQQPKSTRTTDSLVPIHSTNSTIPVELTQAGTVVYTRNMSIPLQNPIKSITDMASGAVSTAQTVPTHLSGMGQLNQMDKHQVTESEEGMMLWKRVRHCVVFGGTFVKSRKEKR